MNLDEFCSGLFENFPKIRYAAIHHISSEKLAGGMRHGLSSFVDEDDHRKRVMGTMLNWLSRNDLKDFAGKTKCIVEHTEKVILLTFPMSKDKLLLISTDPDFDDSPTEKISDFLKNSSINKWYL
jgi:hypothetical protein